MPILGALHRTHLRKLCADTPPHLHDHHLLLIELKFFR